jgi:predicted PurR-regulated permease PerM
MDTYTFVLGLSAIFGIVFLLFYFLRGYVNNRIIKEINQKCEQLESLYKKTQLKINQLSHEYGEPEEIVQGALGDMGISGILEALKVNPDLLTSLAKQYGFEIPGWAIPLIKGFLSKQKGGGDVTSQKQEHPKQT